MKTPVPYRVGLVDFGPVQVMGLLVGPDLEAGDGVLTVLLAPADGVTTFAFRSGG